MNNIIAFTRREADLDHITPILTKFSESTGKDIDVVVMTENIKIDDFRIEMLREKNNIRIHTPAHKKKDIKSNRYKAQEILLNTLRKIESNVPTEIPKDVWDTTIGEVTDKNHNILSDGIVENLFDDIQTEGEKTVVCFDYIKYKKISNIVSKCKEKNLITVGLPHGNSGVSSILAKGCNIENMFEKKKKIPIEESIKELSGTTPTHYKYDFLIYPNQIHYGRFNKMKKNIEADQVVIGCPRYNSEWIKHLDETTERYSTNFNKKNINVVFFSGGGKDYYFEEQIVQSVKTISLLENVNLVVKKHPTRKLISQNHFNNIENVRVVGDQVHSVSLIKWADMIFDLGSSIGFDGVMRKKPVYIIEFCKATDSTITNYFPGLRVESKDDIINSINKEMNPNLDSYKYPENNYNKFRRDLIQESKDMKKEAGVLQKYVDFFIDVSK